MTAAAAGSVRAATPPPEETTLVRRAKAGDAQAFEALFVRNHARITRQVARIVKRREDVEDVVQEIFFKAYRALPQFDGASLFHTWLYRIAQNAAINLVSRQPRFIVAIEDLDIDDRRMPDIAHGMEPEQLLIAKRIYETVTRGMESLTPEMAQPLLLFEVDGHDYKSIAHMLDIPLGTVRTRIHRARKFLARRLERIVDAPRPRDRKPSGRARSTKAPAIH